MPQRANVLGRTRSPWTLITEPSPASAFFRFLARSPSSVGALPGSVCTDDRNEAGARTANAATHAQRRRVDRSRAHPRVHPRKRAGIFVGAADRGGCAQHAKSWGGARQPRRWSSISNRFNNETLRRPVESAPYTAIRFANSFADNGIAQSMGRSATATTTPSWRNSSPPSRPSGSSEQLADKGRRRERPVSPTSTAGTTRSRSRRSSAGDHPMSTKPSIITGFPLEPDNPLSGLAGEPQPI
ncbi:hypothetical protein DFR75_1042 [Nocardia ignorata]|uniref:Uncharacterized protein n=1 Tax=Nocardia ignorata TaxID=145285 RepID=A0A4V3CPF1_NOCIG|nr:hypothetical protein DFR75_1042 [Nocardia ignorata]